MKKEAKTKRKKKAKPAARLAMVLLRYAHGWWEQGKLAAAAGFLRSQVSRWDRGVQEVPDYALERTADVTGFPRKLLGVLLRALRSFLLALQGKSRPRRALAEVSIFELFPLAAKAVDLILEPLDAAGSVAEQAQPLPADREAAESLWERLKLRPEEQRWLLVERVEEFRNWVLIERATAESLDLAPNHPRESLAWAKLAGRIAELVPGSEAWRWRLQGCAGIALTNAHRVCNDLPAGRAARLRARQLWEAGEAGDPGLLNRALLPWIEAAFHRADRDLPEALKRIAEALALDNGELKGKILLTKASIHHAQHEPEASTATLLEALPYLDTAREPRLAFGVCHDLLVNLTDLGRAEEARLRLPEVRSLAERLGGELDGARVTWLEAKVADGLGDLESARAGFERVRSAFQKPELSYDFALVSVDLSLVLLKQGETKRVRTIAEEMAFIFQSQQVHSQALVALRIFCEAAKREAATVELARQVARFLYRAQSDPDLKFEAATEL
jgi:tetratricopeptide (TPR) repeat protein